MAQTQHADVGFGYIECRNNHSDSVEEPHTPVVPFKCAMKMSEVSGIVIQNPLSPTFREEEILEKREKMTDKEQAHDIVSYKPGSKIYCCLMFITDHKNTSQNSKGCSSTNKFRM